MGHPGSPDVTQHLFVCLHDLLGQAPGDARGGSDHAAFLGVSRDASCAGVGMWILSACDRDTI